ncbi:MAG TPA: glycosyltransferase family 4 protein, partial [Actinopolymorphaceae bacterium]|nr:glycosyltransferase family 4 protein [Actinopolymorphaceae bacterium]
ALAELGRRGHEVPRLRVVGDGPERAHLSQVSAASGVNVQFVGELPHDVVVEELAAAEILVVPSRQEALGLAPLEAMAAGCVPVASAAGGLVESVVDGVTGLTCVPDDPAALASALERALAIVHDAERRAAMVGAGDAVARGHDVDALTARTVALYTDGVHGAKAAAGARASGP